MSRARTSRIEEDDGDCRRTPIRFDALTAAVARVQAEVIELKSRPPVAQNVEQAQLDANTDAVTGATATLNGL